MRLAIAALLAAAPLVVGGCGGGGASTHAVKPGPRPDGLVNVQTIIYRSSFDGSRVAGLVAVPRGVSSRGCVIWQSGLGSTKEDSSPAWPGLASLGLSTFSIDFRDHGARASSKHELEQVIRNPKAIAGLIRGTVGDLHSAIDYLQKQPYCRQNVAYVGVSLGGLIGTNLAATDTRVKAVVLISTAGTWRASLTTPGEPILPGVTRDPARFATALRILSPLDPARMIGRISPRPVLILSGLEDKTVVRANARLLQEAARQPKTIVNYNGGHDPLTGPAASSNGAAVTSFLLSKFVEPTYGISGNANGIFTEQ